MTVSEGSNYYYAHFTEKKQKLEDYDLSLIAQEVADTGVQFDTVFFCWAI